MCDGPLTIRNRGASLGVSVRAFLVPGDILYLCTTAVRWNIVALYGPCADFFFFLLKKDGKKRPLLQRGHVHDTTIGRF